VIGAMITAISVTFSVTIVALTVAAQHFGPRVLNSFVRQTSAQVVLGTFLATFAYAVLALGAIRGDGPSSQIPELTVSGAVTLVVLSIGALIYYVHHVSTTLQIGNLAAAIVVDLHEAVAGMDHEIGQHDDGAEAIPAAPRNAAPVAADRSGYVQRIDHAAIAGEAASRDARVWVRRAPGAFVVAGTPLALVHPPSACDDELARAILHACVVGTDRTLWHDVEFGVKQLVEIALRALSPGVNEPFTAITCIDRLTEGLARAAAAPVPRSRWQDEQGQPRVFVQAQGFETLLRAAFDPIRIFGGTNPAIYARLLESLAELGLVARRRADRQLLRREADVVMRTAARNIREDEDLAYVEARYQTTIRQLDGTPASTRRS
jgi:uncharacterized membrane protein